VRAAVKTLRTPSPLDLALTMASQAAPLVTFRHGILPDPQSRPAAQRTANHMPVHPNGSEKEIYLRRCAYTPLVG
jgi:hypothetical protein